jgi:hypothetical protein
VLTRRNAINFVSIVLAAAADPRTFSSTCKNNAVHGWRETTWRQSLNLNRLELDGLRQDVNSFVQQQYGWLMAASDWLVHSSSFYLHSVYNVNQMVTRLLVNLRNSWTARASTMMGWGVKNLIILKRDYSIWLRFMMVLIFTKGPKSTRTFIIVKKIHHYFGWAFTLLDSVLSLIRGLYRHFRGDCNWVICTFIFSHITWAVTSKSGIGSSWHGARLPPQGQVLTTVTSCDQFHIRQRSLFPNSRFFIYDI